MTMYAPIDSPCRIDKKYVVFKNVWSGNWHKMPKNRIIICVLKMSFYNIMFCALIYKKVTDFDQLRS